MAAVKKEDLGQVIPPWTPPGCDRAAHYAGANDTYYDANLRLIVPGQALQARQPAPVQTDIEEAIEAAPETVSESEILGPAELLAQAGSMPWSALLKHAKKLLGPACPASKQQVIMALEKHVAGYNAKKANKRTAKASVEDDAEVEAPPPPAKVAGTKVDLRAWAIGPGRPGGRDYLFAEVRKALRSQYSVMIGAGRNERADAVDFLIANGVVTADEARGDVYK